jgi:SAM-dependent methyltransferase
VTRQQLRLADDSGQDPVLEGALVSPSGARYPVVAGVPRFVGSSGYTQSFGLQWNRFARVQFDSVTGGTYSLRRFDAEVGWDASEIGGKWVVDAGCGAGRFAEIASSRGAEVLAVDLSEAVDAAQANLGHLGNVHVVQADLRALPFNSAAVRHLYSLGVLQHTPDPLAAARALVDFLPPGGKFAFTIYGRRWRTRLYSKYWIRPLTRRLPPATVLRGIERTMPVLFPVTSTLFSIPRVGRLLQFVIPVANYVDHRDLPMDIRYDEAILDTFDMLTPAFDHPVTAEEVEQALSGSAGSLEFTSRVPVVVKGVRAPAGVGVSSST